VKPFGNHPDMLGSYAELSGNPAVEPIKEGGAFQLRRGRFKVDLQVEPSDCEIENNAHFHNPSRKISVPPKPKKIKVESDVTNRIRQLRESRGMNQTAFAQVLGTRPSSVSKWEAGNNRPSPDVFVRIARLARGADKIFFLDQAGVPPGYFEGEPMTDELRDASTELVAKSLAASDSTSEVYVIGSAQPTIPLLKNSKKLGAQDALEAANIESSLSFPSSWFAKDSKIQAARMTGLRLPFIEGDMIALVDISRRDPDRLVGSLVAVRSPAGVEARKLRKDGGTYLLVALQEEAENPVKVLRNNGTWSIVGRIVKWIADAPARK
jgi:transcriptional regulator with XRE-family HTH domain